MKKLIPTLSALALSFSAFAINYKDLDALGVSDKMQTQLRKSIESLQTQKNSVENKFGTFATVGGQVSCDYYFGATRIQDAIDAGETEIRIASDATYIENLAINDKSVVLKGGYADCAAANSNTQSGVTQINGVTAAGFPVISILGGAVRHTIELDSLNLQAGTGTNFYPGGGISTLAADAQITIKNTFISNNIGDHGGGIAIFTGNTDITMVDTLIFSNTASYGGGIYCEGSEASILMAGSSGVATNTADGSPSVDASKGKGGGLYVTNGCDFTSFSGTAGGFFDLRGIAFNNATAQGGGIYADNGATVSLFGFEFCFFSCLGDNTNPANLNGNRADSDGVGAVGFRAGSGAFITGAGTELIIYNGKVTGNNIGSTDSDGGAIYADAGSTFTTARIGGPCWDQEKCNYYADNASGSGIGWGGAFYNRESTMNITSTYIENNRSNRGTVLRATGAGSITTIKASLIHHNGDSGADDFSDVRVFDVGAGAELDVHHSTIADNNARGTVFNINSSSAGTSELYSSIVHDASTGDVYGVNSGVVSVDCSILHELASNPDSNSPSTIATDPEFVDRANNDFHLNATLSPAVDYCDDFGTGPVDYKDMDFEEYGFDDPTVSNNVGPFDVGADETYDNDIIFKNGFE